jgi:hypothetical protein
MLVMINREVFNSLDNISLIWTCIEPTIKQIRGKNFMVKREFSSHLSNSQRSLLMFQILYGHTVNGVIEFYNHLSYILSEKGIWSELKKGMEYFDEYPMANLITEIEDTYHTIEKNYCKEGSGCLDITNINKDSELKIKIDNLNKCLSGLLPAAIKSISSYIRNNPDEFVQFEV